MTPDDLRQITDAVYYVAHTIKVVGTCLIAAIGIVAAFVLVDTTRILDHVKRPK